MTTATDGKAVYTSKKRDDATRGYSALPRGLAGPIPGLGHRRWFLNCAHGPAPFVCPVCKHGFAGIHKRGEICLDCSTEHVMERGSWLERELGIELGCHTSNIAGARNVSTKRTGHRERMGNRKC